MENEVKSGKEILDSFFSTISNITKVDKRIADSLAALYQQGKLTDSNVKNELQRLRDNDANKD